VSSVDSTTSVAGLRPTAGEASAAASSRHAAAGPAGGRGATAPRLGLRFGSSAEVWLAIMVVVVVSLLVVPLPPFALDVFLALSFGLAVVVLLVVISAQDPLEFSIFPSLLLLLTLFRLGLNVSSTRLILSTANAGQVISAFGNFVIGGNLVVGLVIFLILVVINFVVITKGAGRIAEVAARFTLDAMPGRQMSIDADLGAGLIDENEARRRREEINRYADFYGAMDGAAKFVRGDAVAGLIITGINLVGGFVIGMTQRGMSASGSLSTYSTLTVGDGLVTQIPALVVSTAAGILVTYGSSRVAMGPSIGRQLTRSVTAIWTAAGILALFAVVPGLPPVPFLFLAAVAGLLGFLVRRRRRARAAVASEEADTGAGTAAAPALQDLLTVEPLELEIGYGLIPLVDESRGGDLLRRVGILRKQLAVELGIVVPPVRVRDNIQLGAHEYAVKVRGIRVAGSELLPRMALALDTRGDAGPLGGTETTDPSFGLRAVWIQPHERSEAEAAGYTVVDPATVLTTHLMETVRAHGADLLSRQDARELLDGLKDTHPSLVEDVVPAKVSLGTFHRVLQRLVREGVPVRDLVTILETLSDASEHTKDPEVLTEHARRALSMVIAQMLQDPDGTIRALAVGPRLEVALMQTLSPSKQEGGRGGLDPGQLTIALEELGRVASGGARGGALLPLITPPALRVGIRRFLEPSFPRLPVISLAEIPPQTPIQTVSLWELPDAA
jgi:flagellar biosynthesis protein FlhA